MSDHRSHLFAAIAGWLRRRLVIDADQERARALTTVEQLGLDHPLYPVLNYLAGLHPRNKVAELWRPQLVALGLRVSGPGPYPIFDEEHAAQLHQWVTRQAQAALQARSGMSGQLLSRVAAQPQRAA